MKHSIEEWANILFPRFYEEGFLQTLWNAYNPKEREKGWILKSGFWTPWFFQMRLLGDSPILFLDCCIAMADLFSLYRENFDIITAVEMAGINFSGGIAVASNLLNNIPLRIAYTRPLPRKVRTPEEAAELFSKFDAGVADYGEKNFVEGRLYENDRVAIFDDMATNLGSKIIARLTVLWMAKQKGISVTCNEIFYLLNRDPENRQRGLDFAKETAPNFHPASLNVHYIIEVDEHFPDLKKVMHPAEFEVISNYQEDWKRFQNPDERQRVLKLATSTRRG